MKKFDKPLISLDEQVELLIKRGMTVPDKPAAAGHLKFIGYYRFSGYYRYFADPVDEFAQRFQQGTTFQQILDLYDFDQRLRVLLNAALEQIEVAVKACICHEYSAKCGVFWPCSADNFEYGSHPELLKTVEASIRITDDSKPQHIFIQHFYNTYTDKHPPGWMIMETLSFGAISQIFRKSRGELQTSVANIYGVNRTVLESWLHALAFARNVCAHHSRLWNRRFTITPKLPKKYEDWPADARDRLYVVCCIVHHMLCIINPDSRWKYQLRDLLATRGDLPLWPLGFPLNWEQQPFWRFPNPPRDEMP